MQTVIHYSLVRHMWSLYSIISYQSPRHSGVIVNRSFKDSRSEIKMPSPSLCGQNLAFLRGHEEKYSP